MQREASRPANPRTRPDRRGQPWARAMPQHAPKVGGSQTRKTTQWLVMPVTSSTTCCPGSRRWSKTPATVRSPGARGNFASSRSRSDSRGGADEPPHHRPTHDPPPPLPSRGTDSPPPSGWRSTPSKEFRLEKQASTSGSWRVPVTSTSPAASASRCTTSLCRILPFDFRQTCFVSMLTRGMPTWRRSGASSRSTGDAEPKAYAPPVVVAVDPSATRPRPPSRSVCARRRHRCGGRGARPHPAERRPRFIVAAR